MEKIYIYADEDLTQLKYILHGTEEGISHFRLDQWLKNGDLDVGVDRVEVMN